MHKLPPHFDKYLDTLFGLLKASDVIVDKPKKYSGDFETGFQYYPNGCASMPDYNIARDLNHAVDMAFAGASLSSKVFRPHEYGVRAHVDYIEGTLIFNFNVPQELVTVNFIRSN